MTASGAFALSFDIPNPGLIRGDILSPVGSQTLEPVVVFSSAAVPSFDSAIGVELRYQQLLALFPHPLMVMVLVAQVQVGLHLMVHGVGPQGDLEAHMKNKTYDDDDC